MNIISIVIDRLHFGYLGCYGNSWIETPNFDQLAASGFLFDQIADRIARACGPIRVFHVAAGRGRRWIGRSYFVCATPVLSPF